MHAKTRQRCPIKTRHSNTLCCPWGEFIPGTDTQPAVVHESLRAVQLQQARLQCRASSEWHSPCHAASQQLDMPALPFGAALPPPPPFLLPQTWFKAFGGRDKFSCVCINEKVPNNVFFPAPSAAQLELCGLSQPSPHNTLQELIPAPFPALLQKTEGKGTAGTGSRHFTAPQPAMS